MTEDPSEESGRKIVQIAIKTVKSEQQIDNDIMMVFACMALSFCTHRHPGDVQRAEGVHRRECIDVFL